MFDVYKPSGTVGVLTYPLTIVGIVIAILLAFLYQLLLAWIPFIYVSVLLTVGLGTALGIIGAVVVDKGHCRNVIAAGLIGLTLGTVALGAKYFFQHQTTIQTASAKIMESADIPPAMRAGEVERLKQEFTLLEYLHMRADQGWNIGRGGGGAPITGIFVYAIWAIEAGIVCYFCWKSPTAAAAQPYSEKMAQWADEAQVVMTLPVTDQEMVAKIQSADSVEDLLHIPIPKTDQSTQFAVYTVNSIRGQELEDAYLSVTSVAYSINSKGEQETKTKPLVQHAILSSEKREQLIENAELLQEALAEYRASKIAEENEKLERDIASEKEDRDATA